MESAKKHAEHLRKKKQAKKESKKKLRAPMKKKKRLSPEEILKQRIMAFALARFNEPVELPM